MNTHLLHRGKLLLFVGLSLLDLALTRWLIQPGYEELREVNPLAGWVLSGWGWAGLASFKLTMVAMAATLFVVISRYRPGTGARVLNLSCLAVGLVVLYSGYLVASNGTTLAEIHRLEKDNTRLLRDCEKLQAERTALDRFAGDLAADRCTLAEACALLKRHKANDPAWLSNLRVALKCDSDEECLASVLMRNAVSSARNDPAAADRLADRLAADFERQFGSPAPELRPPYPARACPAPAELPLVGLDPNLVPPHSEASSPPLER